MTQAARELDTLTDGDVINGSTAPSVTVNGIPVAVVTSQTVDGNTIITGSDSVFAENLPIARVGDISNNFGTIDSGSPDVFSS